MKFEMKDRCGSHVFGTILQLTKKKKHTHVIGNKIFHFKFALMICSCTYTGLKPQKCSGCDKILTLK
jgi:hypothetical protein